MTTPVTIIGLGAMGSALAHAYINAGHPATVWNRSADKAVPLVAKGAVEAASVEDAVRASPLIITCLTSFEATLSVLSPAELAGRTLVTLNTGSPADARKVASWAKAKGALFLGGAVKNVPEAVGKPDTLLYYGGSRDVFDANVETLRVMGGDTVHLGDEPDLAALYELAVGGTLLPALLGFFQGAALVTARGLAAQSLVSHTVKWFQMIESVLPQLAAEIDSSDYGNPSSALGLFHEGIAHDHAIGIEGNIDMSWNEPIHELLRRAVDQGRSSQSISSLVELLRK
jgi:3-hydroxyisobutyrate dehydrogenase-like beta-hydroxyacid dehydrogenase